MHAQPTHIIRNINKLLNIDVLENTRKREVVEGRIIFTKLMHLQNIHSLSKIGSFVNKGHCTIIHYLKVHDNLFATDKNYQKSFRLISETCTPTFFVSKNLSELNHCVFKIRRYYETSAEKIKHR